MIGANRTYEAQVGIVDLNILPLAMRPQQVSRLGAALAIVLVVAGIAIAPLAFVEHSARGEADVVGRQAKDAQKSLDTIHLSVARNRVLRAQIDAAEGQASLLRATREQIQGGKNPLADDLARLVAVAALQPGLRLASVSGTDTGVRVEGITASPLDAIVYAGSLVQTGGFPSARMASYAPAKAGGQFTIGVVR
jgi:hypothetical protein